MDKLRVMYVLHHFPQISETYIRSELEAIRNECEVRIFALQKADAPYRNHEPYVQTDDADVIKRAIGEFRPHVLHTHWLTLTREVAYLAGYFGKVADEMAVPFTIRSHSFDILEEDGRHIRDAAPMINSDLCLGVLAFPFALPLLERHGVRREKLVGCWPVVNYARFHDESPNGRDVMNVGACLPKKRMEDFLKLATVVPDRRFNLYPMGYRSRDIDKLNETMGHPVSVVPSVEPDQMLAEYKKHEWLVYTASRDPGTVGWSLAVAEAQAAGVGVCFPRLRPDLDEYVGTAGYLYDSIEEVADVIKKPFPEEKRRLGFEHARRSDVFRHIQLLTKLWHQAAATPDEFASLPRTARHDDGLPDWCEADTRLERKARFRRSARELASVVPKGGALIVAGDVGEWADPDLLPGRRVLPFVEKDGQFWGPPADDDTAVTELERMRQSGRSAIVFIAANFWWLDHYRGFADHLRTNYPRAVENAEMVVFDLGQATG